MIIIQIRFGKLDCVQYTSSDSQTKVEEISGLLAENIRTLCSCQFNSSFLLRSHLLCFDQSPQIVTYRAQLSGTNQVSASALVTYIEQWINTNSDILVQKSRVSLNTSCALVIPSFDSEECPGVTNEISLLVIISGAAGGGVVLVAMMIFITICIRVIKVKGRKKKFDTKE